MIYKSNLWIESLLAGDTHLKVWCLEPEPWQVLNKAHVQLFHKLSESQVK